MTAQHVTPDELERLAFESGTTIEMGGDRARLVVGGVEYESEAGGGCPCLPGAPEHVCGEGGYALPLNKPGIYGDVPMVDYLAHPAISATGLKRMLPPSCPAKFKHGDWRSTPAMDFGKLVHHELLDGADEEFVVSPFDSFRTKEARAWKAEQEAAGRVIVDEEQIAVAREMAKRVREHPTAGPLFTDGKPEQTMLWTDAETGVQCRARFDWLREPREGRRLIFPDYKTAATAEPVEFGKVVARRGYHQSAAHYIDGLTALGLDPDPLPVLVAQEKEPPYLVQTYVLRDEDIKLGRDLNRRALRLYAECLASDTWPGYADGVTTVDLPSYYVYATEEYLTHDRD